MNFTNYNELYPTRLQIGMDFYEFPRCSGQLARGLQLYGQCRAFDVTPPQQLVEFLVKNGTKVPKPEEIED